MAFSAALDTVGQYIDESRRVLQDQVDPFRYPDVDIVEGLNIGLGEARRLRADLFLPLFDLPYFDTSAMTPTTPADATLRAKKVTFDPQYRSALVYYICGRMQVRDDEPTTDSRAGAMLTKFTQQLLAIAS